MAIQLYRPEEPTVLPVTLADAKSELELVGAAHDSKITRQIHAARGIWERYTRRAAVPQRQVFIVESDLANQNGEDLAGSPAGGPAQIETIVACNSVMELPRPPFVSIETVESRDAITDPYVVADAADYTEDLGNIARVIWTLKTPCYRRVTYECGYPDGELPAEFQETILKLVVFLFENRGDVESKLPHALKMEMASQATGDRVGYWS